MTEIPKLEKIIPVPGEVPKKPPHVEVGKPGRKTVALSSEIHDVVELSDRAKAELGSSENPEEG